MENRLDSLLRKEELFWLQMSRVSWMGEGDANTIFFHKIANGRKKLNTIIVVRNGVGVWCKKEEEIQKAFLDYYTGLFTTKVT